MDGPKMDFTTATVLKPHQKIGRSKHHIFHLSTCYPWDFSLPLSRWWDWRKSKMLIQFTCSHKYENFTIKNLRLSKVECSDARNCYLELSHLFVWRLIWCWGLWRPLWGSDWGFPGRLSAVASLIIWRCSTTASSPTTTVLVSLWNDGGVRGFYGVGVLSWESGRLTCKRRGLKSQFLY